MEIIREFKRVTEEENMMLRCCEVALLRGSGGDRAEHGGQNTPRSLCAEALFVAIGGGQYHLSLL